MSIATIYYVGNLLTSITKVAIEHRKVRELSALNLNIQKHYRISESILQWINIIRDDIQSLMHMYFKSGFENLKYALSSNDVNCFDYLRQARNRFIDASTIEKNENLILTFVGLSMCQLYLGDIENSISTLKKIDEIEYDTSLINWDNVDSYYKKDLLSMSVYKSVQKVTFGVKKKLILDKFMLTSCQQ